MSIVIGILNKYGAVVAADSAAESTLNEREWARVKPNEESPQTKYTSVNVAKLMRLTSTCNAPISIMFTGNAAIKGKKWPDIIRQYRSRHGGEILCDMMGYVESFLGFSAESLDLTIEEKDFVYNEEKDTTIVFVGFGADDKYPSLIPMCVHREESSLWFCNKEENVIISTENSAAIKYYGCTKVVESLLQGVNVNHLDPKFSDSLLYNIIQEKSKINTLLPYETVDGIISMVRVDEDKNLEKWEKQIECFDIPEMVNLANTLVDLTGLYYILRMLTRKVSEPIYMATITKKEGFKWVQCKNGVMSSYNFQGEPLNR